MKLSQKLRSPEGFTLVELIIVIMIIGILAATLLPKVMGAPAKARDAARQADFNSLVTAMELYHSDNDAYPAYDTVGLVDQNADAVLSLADHMVENGYLKAGLQDPQDEAAYVYVYCAATRNGVADQAFAVGTRLESSTSSVRSLEAGDPIITAASGDTVADKATTKLSAIVATYTYGDSDCADF